MKQLLLLVLAISMTIGLFAIPMWDNPVPIRQGDQVEWNRCGATTADGCMIYVWSGTKRGDRDLYAQKVTATGELLWQLPLVVNSNPCRQSDPVITRTTDDNYVVVWNEYINNSDAYIKAQKFSSTGQLFWSLTGITICSIVQNVGTVLLKSDNNNGVYIVWADFRNSNAGIYGQHLGGIGNMLWSVDGIPLANSSIDLDISTICIDATGALIISYLEKINYIDQIKIKRFFGSGQASWSQPLTISAGYAGNSAAQLCPIPDSTIAITWCAIDYSALGGMDIFADRFNLQGNLLWSSPIKVFSDVFGHPTQQNNPRIVDAGDNSVIITWEDKRNDSVDPDIYAQKVSISGSLLWNSDGIPVCTSNLAQKNQSIESDYNGGCYIVWEHYRANSSIDIYTQHISAGGNILLNMQGQAICTAEGSQYSPMVSNVNNTIFISWADERTGSPGVYFQTLNNVGNLQLEINGRLIYQGLTSNFSRDNYRVLSRTNDAAIIWSDYRKGRYNASVYYQFLNSDGSVDFEDNGRPLTLNSGCEQTDIDAIVIPNDEIVVVWVERHKIKAQLLDADGNRLWGDYGFDVTEDTLLIQAKPKISYEDGALYVGWVQTDTTQTLPGIRYYSRIFGQKIVGNQKQWGTNGILISEFPDGDLLYNDQLKQIIGRYYIWTRYLLHLEDYQNMRVCAKLVNPDGTTAVGWLDSGVPVTDSVAINMFQYQSNSILTNTGLMIVWLEIEFNSFSEFYYGQMISPQGTRLWGSSGIEISDSFSPSLSTSLINIDNDVMIFYVGYDDLQLSILAQIISPSGENVPGSPLSANQQGLAFTNPVSAQFPNGRILVSWGQKISDIANTNRTHVYYRFISPEGDVLGAIGEIYQSSPIDEQNYQKVIVVGNEAYLFWADSELYANENTGIDRSSEGYSLYAQKLSNEAVVNDDETSSPAVISLEQNYPNPFNPTTNISFNLKGNADATLTIYNQKGQKVRTLHNGLLDKGRHDFTWNGKDDNNKQVASGIYMYRLTSENTNLTKKMVLLK